MKGALEQQKANLVTYVNPTFTKVEENTYIITDCFVRETDCKCY